MRGIWQRKKIRKVVVFGRVYCLVLRAYFLLFHIFLSVLFSHVFFTNFVNNWSWQSIITSDVWNFVYLKKKMAGYSTWLHFLRKKKKFSIIYFVDLCCAWSFLINWIDQQSKFSIADFETNAVSFGYFLQLKNKLNLWFSLGNAFCLRFRSYKYEMKSITSEGIHRFWVSFLACGGEELLLHCSALFRH